VTSVETISLPTPFSIGDVNVYLIDSEPLTLFDSGPLYQPAYDALEEALGRRGRRVEDLGLVVLTHQHFDHVGLAATLHRKGARIAALSPLADRMERFEDSVRAEDRFAVGVMGSVGVPEELIQEIASVASRYWRYGESVEVADRLEDGDVLSLGDRQLVVQHRPGHSPTDTVFVDVESGEAIVGDHLLLTISSNPVAHRPASGSEDPAEREPALIAYLDSLRRTRDLDLQMVWPGHRKPIDDPRPLIDKRIVLHERRAETILELVRNGDTRVMEIADHLWSKGVPVNQTYLAISEVLGHLDLLIRDGRVVPSTDGGITTYVATAPPSLSS
jgi:glyoxylase-like metal-dependent hydrolase (beta-lactamase superfamily II)